MNGEIIKSGEPCDKVEDCFRGPDPTMKGIIVSEHETKPKALYSRSGGDRERLGQEK